MISRFIYNNILKYSDHEIFIKKLKGLNKFIDLWIKDGQCHVECQNFYYYCNCKTCFIKRYKFCYYCKSYICRSCMTNAKYKKYCDESHDRCTGRNNNYHY